MTSGEPAMAEVGEPILDPDLEILDSHHHLWEAHEPPYLLADLLADCASGHRVTTTIFVECGWGVDHQATPPQFGPVAEVALAVETAAESRRLGQAEIAAVIGHADLRYGNEAGAVLDALAAKGNGLFVGIRQVSAWDPATEISDHPSKPGRRLLGRSDFLRGFGQLAARGLTFDAWLYHPQLPELVSLARAFPEVRIIVNHLGGPLDVGPYANRRQEVHDHWRSSMTALALCPNVCVKLGGIAMSALAGSPLDDTLSSQQLVQRWGGQIRWCIEQFGVERCMFESNFPVDKRQTSYVSLWNAFKMMVAGASSAEKSALFRETARTVYGLRGSS